MSASPAERAFRKSLTSKAFAPVYLLHGEEEFLKEQAVRDLVAAAVDEGTRDFNLDIRTGDDLTAETIGSLLATPPMMADRRVVVFRDAGALKKDARQAVERHLESLARRGETQVDVVLVLVMAAAQKLKKNDAFLNASMVVEFGLLTGDRLPKWIAHYARSELGVEIAPEALALLERVVGNDLPAIASELDKLASYTRGSTIDEASVGAVVGVRHGETLGDLLDLVAARNAAGALALLPHILEQPRNGGVPIVMALTVQTLAVSYGKGLREHGMPAGALKREYFELLKVARNAWRPWGEAADAWARAVDQWDPPALDAALAALNDADEALKTTRLSSDQQVIATLILTMCGASGAAGRRSAA
ncbi:MAG TPA: DNA polymerase III subunit delta, partial [Gemmatimonadaceae bacterium]|nr:DNA polymerase III subunit delta [Gemmatimonadaceae bacterium]